MCLCPDCRKERARNVLAGKLPARGVHDDYLEPCPCIAAMEAHSIDYDAWADLLHRYAPADYHELPRPAFATAARPGSEARIAVMAARYDRGESLWHRKDLTQLDTLGQVGRHGANGRELDLAEVAPVRAILAQRQQQEEAWRLNGVRKKDQEGATCKPQS